MEDKQIETLVVLGNDKVGAQAMALPEMENCKVKVLLDSSSSMGRVFRLIRRRRLRFGLVVKMFLAEMKRSRPKRRVPMRGEIASNKDLLKAIADYQPKRVILFRAGLIINRSVIAAGVPLLNIHCARVPEYGGLGSIDRALGDRAFDQEATLHQVTETIDKGEVFDIEPYHLDGSRTYSQNEGIAYDAGIRLLKRTLV